MLQMKYNMENKIKIWNVEFGNWSVKAVVAPDILEAIKIAKFKANSVEKETPITKVVLIAEED